MDLESLRLFLQVAAVGSFSRAALLAGTTQSAVSKRILALERELAVPLFERTGRGVRLTDAGTALVPRADELATGADGLRDFLATDLARPRGPVRLAMQPSTAWPLLGELFPRVRRDYPAIHLFVSEGPTSQVHQWLHEGRADIGVLSRHFNEELAQAELLASPPILLVSRPGEAATSGATVPFRKLAGLPLIIASMPNGGRVLLEEEARKQRIKLDVVMDVYPIHLTKKLVREGLAYSVAVKSAIVDELAAGQLAAARIVAPQLREHYFLSLSPARRPSAAVRAVAQAIRDLNRSRPAG